MSDEVTRNAHELAALHPDGVPDDFIAAKPQHCGFCGCWHDRGDEHICTSKRIAELAAENKRLQSELVITRETADRSAAGWEITLCALESLAAQNKRLREALTMFSAYPLLTDDQPVRLTGRAAFNALVDYLCRVNHVHTVSGIVYASEIFDLTEKVQAALSATPAREPAAPPDEPQAAPEPDHWPAPSAVLVDGRRAEELANKRLKAHGSLAHRHGGPREGPR